MDRWRSGNGSFRLYEEEIKEAIAERILKKYGVAVDPTKVTVWSRTYNRCEAFCEVPVRIDPP